MKNLIEQYNDIFTWLPVDMLGINISIVYYKLLINQSIKPVQKKKINHGAKCQKAIKEKVTKLLQAGFIRKVPHTTWLPNMVLVKKSNRR